MRVCIVAENVSKHFGGEAVLPYQYFRILLERSVDVRLVTHARTRLELQYLFPEDLDRIFFVEDMALQKLLSWLANLFPGRVSDATFGLANQLLTQLAQRTILRRLIQQYDIEVIHQPIPISPRYPSLMFGLGRPLVVGPLGGGMTYPPAFRAMESLPSRLFVTIARALTNPVNSVLPGKKRAAIVLVNNERTRRSLPAGIRGRVVQMSEIGINFAEWSLSTGRSPTRPPTFVFIGRLVDWKALDIAIRALHSIPEAHIDAIGDGPMLSQWKNLATELGVASRVNFMGWQSQAQCARSMDDSVALILPSIYECGGTVVIEAMAMAKPVIATRWGGPEETLDATCGILVDPTSPQILVDGFAAAMQRLIDSPELCRQLGAAGRKRVSENYDWEKKVDVMLQLYTSATAFAGEQINPRSLKYDSLPISEPIPQFVPHEHPQFDVSIIIVSFNTRETLRDCLKSVLLEAGDLSIEILVVDNNSADGSPEMVEKDYPQVHLIRSGTNLGFGAANNVALQQARGRYFILLNSDAFLQPGALAASIRLMDEYPACGLAGGRLTGRDGLLQPSGRSFPTLLDDALVATGLAARFPKSKFFGHFDRTWADDQQRAEVDWVPGAFCIIRPVALARTGLFNPVFFLYLEEVDLCRRIKLNGYQVWYWPDISIVHIGGESSRQINTLTVSSSGAQVVLWRMRSSLLYYRMYHGWKVHLARWLELAIYAGRLARNRIGRDPIRQERSRSFRTLIQLMNRAWNDTREGTVSPPRPW